jgi:hypothetical protein
MLCDSCQYFFYARTEGVGVGVRGGGGAERMTKKEEPENSDIAEIRPQIAGAPERRSAGAPERRIAGGRRVAWGAGSAGALV